MIRSFTRVFCLTCCPALVTLMIGVAPAAATAASPIGTIVATVRNAEGEPIAGARVVLINSTLQLTYTSDARGSFSGQVPPGTYALSARAPKYAGISGSTLTVAAGRATTVTVTMALAQASSINVLGRVTVNGADSVSTSPAHIVEISAQEAAARGETQVSTVVADELSTTIVPVAGAGFNAPAAVALRGPDPSETLIEIDGHQVNNGNEGAFDLSLLDPADLQSVQIAYGIAPSSLFGPDTLGGAINVRTLEPTDAPHSLIRFSAGSYGTFGQTIQATGTDANVGYAASIHRATSSGEIDRQPFISDGVLGFVGDGLDATSSIVKLRYGLDRGQGFVGVSLRDQAVYRDLSAALSSVGQSVQSGAGAALLGHNADYGFDADLPIGNSSAGGTAQTSALFRHLTSLVAQSSLGPASTASPFLYNSRDVISDDTLEVTRALDRGALSIKFAAQNELLVTDYLPGGASSDSVVSRPLTYARSLAIVQAADALPRPAFSQTSHSLGLLYTWSSSPQLHYSLATYASDYSTFGHSFDPRAGIVWAPNASSALRGSVGSTFQSPQLPSLYVPPVLPPPVNGYINIGNPHLQPDRATEYDFGYDRFFDDVHGVASVSADLYRTDLRNAITTYIPPATCSSPPTGPPPCLSYPINAAGQVYTGAEVRASVPLSTSVSARAGFGVDSVYLTDVPAAIQDGTLVPNEQALGVPLHKATLTIERGANGPLAWYAGILHEGAYNELNRPPFTTIGAGATLRRPHFDVGVYGTNLTNVNAEKFTQVGFGVPYGGVNGPIATDALPLAGRAITFVVTLHR